MLKNMLEAFAEYKGLTLILIVCIILLIISSFFAARASRRRSSERDKIIKKLMEEQKLCEEFAVLTPEKVLSEPPERVMRGVTFNIRKFLNGEPDINAAFEKLGIEEQYIYALDYVFCEDADTLSKFFRLNGKPLTTAADSAVNEIFGGEIYEIFHKGFRMFDDDDEEISSLPEDVKKLDEDFKNAVGQDELKTVSRYISERCENFYNNRV
ncbi:MAG: hypothetical protein K6F09_07700 [Clostridiales bacterium]|nr:hypothetical protein [Clostridiales bacterium]